MEKTEKEPIEKTIELHIKRRKRENKALMKMLEKLSEAEADKKKSKPEKSP